MSCTTHRLRSFHPYMSNQCIVNRDTPNMCIPLPYYGLHDFLCQNILTIYMKMSFSSNILISSLGDTDNIDYKDPPMSLRVFITDIDDNFNVTETENNIDVFMTSHLWWKRAYDFYNQKSLLDSSNTFLITIERYPLIWRPYLDFIVKTQYLTEEDCSKTPMIIGRVSGIHPGLTPILSESRQHSMSMNRMLINILPSYCNKIRSQ